jgi:hypothetical protein
MQISAAGTGLASNRLLAESNFSSRGRRLITIHRPESRRLILQRLTLGTPDFFASLCEER